MELKFTVGPLTNTAADHEKEQAAEILNLAFRSHWPTAWETIEEGREEVGELLAEDRFILAAFLPDGRVVGWIGGIPEYDGLVWELHPLAVHPDFQRQGIGRALVAAFEVEVRARGGLTIQIGTDDEDGSTSLSNTDLYEDTYRKMAELENHTDHPVTFYQKLGYRLIGVMPDANGIGKPDLIMGKRVPDPLSLRTPPKSG
jgi:aminoglycoside 6'-N-acetyltransferase I